MLDADAIFQEIAAQVSIDPDLTVRHPLYPAWPISELVSQRLQNSPREIQAKFLCTQLQAYLHSIYCSRALRPLMAVDAVENTQPVISNNTSHGLDAAFYAQIDRANCSQGYYDLDWIIEGEEEDGMVAVVKDGLRLHLLPTYIHPAYETLDIGDAAAIVLPKNLLTIDRYIAISNYGRVQQLPILHLYFSCPPETAIELITTITSELNALAMPFELQVQIDPELYQQTDGLILQLATADYAKAQPVLSDIYQHHRSHFYDQTPSFTQAVATGVGLCRLPTNKQGILHLWQLVAQSLATSWLLNIIDPAVKLDRLWQTVNAEELEDESRSYQQLISNDNSCLTWL
jgi:HopA1 effector protein family